MFAGVFERGVSCECPVFPKKANVATAAPTARTPRPVNIASR